MLAKRVNAQLEAGAADYFHIDDILQVFDIGQNEVFLVRSRHPAP